MAKFAGLKRVNMSAIISAVKTTFPDELAQDALVLGRKKVLSLKKIRGTETSKWHNKQEAVLNARGVADPSDVGGVDRVV